MAAKKDKVKVPLKVKRSYRLFIVRMLILQIVFVILISFLSGGLTLLVPLSAPFVFTGVSLALIIPLLLFDCLLSFYLAWRWRNEDYEIHTNKIVHKKGVLFRSVATYEVNNIERIRMNQDLLGRILNYGSILIYDPALQKDIIIDSIPEPQKCKKLVRKVLLKIKDSKTQFIIR